MAPWKARWKRSGLILLLWISGIQAQAAIDWTGFHQITRWFFDDCPEGRPCQLLYRQLWRDSLYCNRSPAAVMNLREESGPAPQEIDGTIAFAGFLTNPYRYTVIQEKDEVTIEVRIHLYRGMNSKVAQALSEADTRKMDFQLERASRIWNRRAPAGVDFRFLLVQDRRDAHFSVRAVDHYTRGPYHLQWSTNWASDTIAHEIGHMMGLDDEYELLNESLTNCPDSYLMCTVSGSPQPYYYYLILRRAYCH